MLDNDDASFLDSVPYGTLLKFRNKMYTQTHIEENPERFIDTSWVDIVSLRKFMTKQGLKNEEATRVRRVPDASKPPDVIVKAEPDLSPSANIKVEASDSTEIPSTSAKPTYRTLLEGGKEVLELFSSDDEDGDQHQMCFDDPGASSDTMVGIHSDHGDSDSDFNFGAGSDSESEPDHNAANDSHLDLDLDLEGKPYTKFVWVPSDTIWLDSDVSSKVSHGYLKLHRQLKVNSVEYVKGLPSYWPIPREKRAYLVDLSDAKYEIYDSNGKLLPVDATIKNADQDSWTGCTGQGDSGASFHIFTGSKIECRRSRLDCSGCHACEYVDKSLIDIERFELDPDQLEGIVRKQIESRVSEADTPEKKALIFFAICHARPCTAKTSNGRPCNGTPVLKRFEHNESFNGKQYFISCSGLSKQFRKEHSQASIPESVDEELLVELFAGRPLKGFDLLETCSRIVAAYIGGKIKTCKYTHTGDGKQAKMVRLECNASRTIFVPLDPTIRMALVVPNHEHGHNHPILPATKASKMIKELYQKCVRTAGVVGSTVLSVENARSTKLILGDKTPSLVNPILTNSRVKQDIIREEKKKAFPHGTGLEGVMHLLQADLKKPVEERYVHSLKRLPNGGTIIVTAEPFFLSRVHKAKTLQVDTTFKRVVGELKEWEVVIWDEETQNALTIARIYSNHSDRVQYKNIFADLDQATETVTGNKIRLKRLCEDGTLLTIGVDMELAQALGAGDHFLPSNDPEFSKINVTSAEDIIEYFIRVCSIHSKRGVQGLKPHVSEEDHKRLMNFLYLKSQEEVDEFTRWVKELNVKQVSDWWQHKLDNKWILPALIKSLSKIDPEDWDKTDSTTNLNESQHHYTNINTGIKLSLVEAILTAQDLDRRTAAELKKMLASGIQKSKRNDTYSRMSRGVARARNTTKKIKEAKEHNQALDSVNEDIKQSAAHLKELRAQKAHLAATKPKKRALKAESSSSGRVTGSSKSSRAKDAAKAGSKKKQAAAARVVTAHKAQIPLASPMAAVGELQCETMAVTVAAEQDFDMNDDTTLHQQPLSEMTAQINLFQQGYEPHTSNFSLSEEVDTSHFWAGMEGFEFDALVPPVGAAFDDSNPTPAAPSSFMEMLESDSMDTSFDIFLRGINSDSM